MKRIIAYILFFFLVFTLQAQQYVPGVSQYMFHGLLLNPAIAGSDEVFSAGASYRSQWLGADGAPNTQLLSLSTPLKNERMALGGYLYRDQLGVTNKMALYLTGAYRLSMGAGKLSFGLSAGVNSEKNKWTKIQTTTSNDPTFSQDSRVSYLPNFSWGTYYYTPQFYVSVSVPFILGVNYNGENTSTSFNVQQWNWHISGGYKIDLFEDWSLLPSILYKTNLGISSVLDGNMMVRYLKKYELGVGYRSNGQWVVMAKCKLNQKWTLGYALDGSFTKEGPPARNSHEITLFFELKEVINTMNPKFF